MNYGGNLILLSNKNDLQDKYQDIKLWYLLYKTPHNQNEYYSAISMANIYINEKYLDMTYNLQYKNSILDHININKQ